ncbi:MAG TPA: hypothetical protein VFR47_16965 [Anaerolineales bacterium]|nr:hypothetical protein [Anaerolineales bacterium]
MLTPEPWQRTPGLWWWEASRRVFRQFAWLEAGSDKVALSRTTWWLSLSKPTSAPQDRNANR